MLNTEIRDAVNFFLNPPQAVLNFTSLPTATNATFLLLSWSNEVKDTDAMHSTTTNLSRININTAGRFRIEATISFNSSSVGRRTLVLRKNAAGNVASGTYVIQDNRAAPVSGSG